ncbi:chitobiase/beta-hexosaminidase C-terminal domain-containing protein [Maribacter aestuarii]|uniref:chitobiase/beta-hexosaminidase C-terminal domain-containing protein n=1 Tax=Maribacter aestuarii TaxID=1130723 RepID=UPI00248C6421|nr:chitobiase/beta-hexosaminidase C-terminal domain-containing protein [Maribacter aestuarii]
MRYIFCICLLLFSCEEEKEGSFASAEIFQLAPPIVQIDSLLFAKSARLEAKFDMPEAIIRYTEDGSEVTATSQPYTQPIQVTKTSEFAFRVFHPQYQESQEIRTQLLRIKQKVSDANISINPAAHPNYPGQGARSLVDLQKGTTQFRAGNKWLGFQTNKVKFLMDFKDEIPVSNLILSTLNDHGSWIFMPRAIRVFSNTKQIGELLVKAPTQGAPKQMELLDVPVVNGAYKNVEIQIDLMETIPEWHQGKGTIPFFFIDEIVVQ